MNEKRRSFYGWGYEGDTVSPAELQWFEDAWSKLLKVDRFEPAPLPREEEIELREPRVAVPESLKNLCTSDKYERLLHSYGRSGHELARMILRRDFSGQVTDQRRASHPLPRVG